MDVARCEGCSHRSFRHGQTDACVSSFQGATIIATIATHNHLSSNEEKVSRFYKFFRTIIQKRIIGLPKIFHAFNQMNFLVWQHSCKDFSPLNYTIQQCTIVVSNQSKCFSITCKHVILFLHGAFKIGLEIILNSMKKCRNFI